MNSRERFDEAVKQLGFSGDIECLYPLWLKCKEYFLEQIVLLEKQISDLYSYIEEGPFQ